MTHYEPTCPCPCSKTDRERLRMGPETLEIPPDLFGLNRRRLVERLRPRCAPNTVVLLQGGEELPFYDTDIVYNFRQESFFMWAFGVVEPGFMGAIEVDTGTAHLFPTRLDKSYSVWLGTPLTLRQVSRKYDVAEVHYKDELCEVLGKIGAKVVLVLKGVNSDSDFPTAEVKFPGMEKFNVKKSEMLHEEMSDLRVFKTDHELRVIKYVVGVSCEAHRKVMRYVKEGKSEYMCESEFLNHCYTNGGCRFFSYTCICCSGENSSILHYGHAAAPNNRCLRSGDMCLFDMGANYFGYCSDITCSFPVGGKFSPSQRLVYEAVLEANRAVFAMIKPGVSWVEAHLLASRVLLEGLVRGGLLRGEAALMVEAGLGPVFQPHGMGHLMGLDVHDVGAYLKSQPPRPDPGRCRGLRTARVLGEGMVVTIEPGCYFIDQVLEEAYANEKQSKFLVREELEKFKGFGGVRIEDDVLITKDGAVNFSSALPRTVEEIEEWMSGKGDEKYK